MMPQARSHGGPLAETASPALALVQGLNLEDYNSNGKVAEDATVGGLFVKQFTLIFSGVDKDFMGEGGQQGSVPCVMRSCEGHCIWCVVQLCDTSPPVSLSSHNGVPATDLGPRHITVQGAVIKAFYQILVASVLLNILIAMINEKYSWVREQEEYVNLRNKART